MSLEVNIEKCLGDFLLKVCFQCDGEQTAVLGASGCGKSMMLKCIAGIMKPDRGRIVLNDKVLFDSEKKINLPPQKRHVGYLFQNYALFPNMTVEQNIVCGLHEEKDSEQKRIKMKTWMAKLQLEGLEKHKPYQLSGGQQQRVALARILVGNPEILMLDEPFSALDSYLRDQLLIEIKNILAGFQKDVLMVTHNRDEAYALCQNLMIMDKGRISCQGKTKDVFAHPQNIQGAILTGCKNIYKARKLDEKLVEITDLGMIMETQDKVHENLCAVGIRAHHFSPDIQENVFDVVLDEEVEASFEWTVKFRYRYQKPDTPSVWWRMPKEKKPEKFPSKLGIMPEHLLLLYEKNE